MAKSEETKVKTVCGSGSSARKSRFARRTSQRRDVIGFELSQYSVCATESVGWGQAKRRRWPAGRAAEAESG